MNLKIHVIITFIVLCISIVHGEPLWVLHSPIYWVIDHFPIHVYIGVLWHWCNWNFVKIQKKNTKLFFIFVEGLFEIKIKNEMFNNLSKLPNYGLQTTHLTFNYFS